MKLIEILVRLKDKDDKKIKINIGDQFYKCMEIFKVDHLFISIWIDVAVIIKCDILFLDLYTFS